MTERFDTWLEKQLRASLTPVQAKARPPALESLLGTEPETHILTLPRRFSTPLAAGLAAAALAVAGGGYAVASVANGSPNPTVWGQQVKQQVEACQDNRTSSERGIGQCVSSFARQNGQAHQAQHESVPGSPKAAEGADTGNGHGKPGAHPNQPTPKHSDGGPGGSGDHHGGPAAKPSPEPGG